MNPHSSPDPLLLRFDALADPARLRLLALLSERELTVSDLAEILQLPQSTVSRHLRVLADGNWVAARGEGTANLYRMLDGDLPEPSRRLWEIARAELVGWPALAQDRVRLERRLERRKNGGGFFAGVAGEWDRLRRELYGERFTDEALRALLPSDWTVADLACGSGSVAELLAPRVSKVIAVDLSPEMLSAARARLAARPNVELRQGALEELPIDGGACDATLMLLALTHVAEPARAVEQMARVLKPGGRAVVVDLLRHDRDDFRRRVGALRNGFEPRELTDLLEQAGLEDVRCETLPPEAGAKGPALLLATATKPDPRNGRTARSARERRAGAKRSSKRDSIRPRGILRPPGASDRTTDAQGSPLN